MPNLLDRGAPHVVQVQNRTVTRDTGGRRMYANVGDRIPHRCAVQVARDWSSAEEQMTAGLQVLDMRVIYSRNWSGDEHSAVFWDGDEYEMVGAPQPLKMSKRTGHWRVTVRRIGVDPEA